MRSSIDVPRAAARLALALGIACALAPRSTAQEIEKVPAPKPGEARRGDAPGPAATRTGRFLIGDQAPDIDLTDEDGRRFQLGVERKARPLLIAFARRPEDALEIERARAPLDTAGIASVLIAPFHRDRLAELMGPPRVRFLHDRISRIARLYGLFDAVTSNARPGAILIDERGRIRLIVAGIMPTGVELTRSATEALEQSRADQAKRK